MDQAGAVAVARPAAEHADAPGRRLLHRVDDIEIAHVLNGADLDAAAVRRTHRAVGDALLHGDAILSAGPAAVRHRYLIRRGDGRPDEGDESW